jgi:hypothetical protein
MQKWEYKAVTRVRNFIGSPRARQMWEWSPDSLEMSQRLAEMGEEGWELVAVVTESGTGGHQVAGITTEEVWVFKRPKA